MTGENLPRENPSRDESTPLPVFEVFQSLIGRFGEHAVAAGSETYIQPCVYLSMHLVQMHAAGWTDVDFDQIAAVSGASALFAYQPDSFMPKYAHLEVEPHRRIAEATGFGYEWAAFEGREGAWAALRESVDAGLPVKGWDWENILFADYRDAARAEDRQAFAMADGPDTYARWLTWDEFCEWVARVEEWGCPQFGRYAGRVDAMPPRDIALRVIEDLVAWSVQPPEAIRRRYPEATFGLAGIEAYAGACEASDPDEDWVVCHPINPQWNIRNATGVYLGRIAKAGIFSDEVNAHLLAASVGYRAAFECWQAYYKLLGHRAAQSARRTPARRLAGAAIIRAWLEHERAALGDLERALDALG